MRKYAVLALAAGLALAFPMAADAQNKRPTGHTDQDIQNYNPSEWDPGPEGTVAGSRSGRAGDQVIVTGPNDFTKANSVRAVKIDPMIANTALNTQAEHERRQSAQAKVGAHPRVLQALESAGIGINSITDVAVENGLATIYYTN
jgi:hypothetical protein